MNERAVIVTGAAGGVGMDTSATLARRGYCVYAGAIDDWEMQELQNLKQLPGVERLVPVMLDMRKHEQIAAVVSQIERDNRKLVGLVLNGAASPAGVPVVHTPVALLRDTFEANVIGAFAAVQHCFKQLDANRGTIVFVSSATSLAPPPLVLPYVSTKCAINAMAHSMRREFRNSDIRVSLLIPTIIKRTYMAHGLFEATKRRLADIRGCKPIDVHPATYDPGKNTALLQAEGAADPFYEGMYQGQLQTIAYGLETGIEPSVVTRDIIDALEARSPRLVYYEGIGSRAFRLLAWLLPISWLDRLLAKIGYR